MEPMIALEPWLRLGVFAGVFALVAAWEGLAPRRMQAVPRAQRWPANLGLVVFNTALLRLLMPLSAVALAAEVQQRGLGLLHGLADWPWLQGALAVLALDLAIYLQHRLFHAVPWLWRLHRMHHADTEFDVTNGLRFHPLEILLSMVLKFAVIVALGAPPMAVLVFELLLNGMAMFNHGNIRVGERADRWLRWLVVTPDMHRIHHSVHADEHHRNFGFNLSCWDRLFGTHVAQPRDGQTQMALGLPRFRDAEARRFSALLMQPWR